MRSGHTSRELWSLDLNTLMWERVETNQGRCMISGPTGQAKLCGPVHSMGHTANVIAQRMIVIFGHSPKYGYLSTVQVRTGRRLFTITSRAHFSTFVNI